MEPIKVSVDITVDLSESTKAFFNALFAKSSTTASEAPAAPVALTRPAVPAKPAPETSAPGKPAPEAPAPGKPASEAHASTITIEDVRKALSEKVNAHRNEIKDKLSALGAPSVTKLDQSKYQEMYDFLIALD